MGAITEAEVEVEKHQVVNPRHCWKEHHTNQTAVWSYVLDKAIFLGLCMALSLPVLEPACRSTLRGLPPWGRCMGQPGLARQVRHPDEKHSADTGMCHCAGASCSSQGGAGGS